MISILTPELEKHAKEVRAFRRSLAHERCNTDPDGCGGCELKDVHECETCGDFGAACLLANVREVVECQKCSDAREAHWRREVRTHVPVPSEEEAREVRRLKGMTP